MARIKSGAYGGCGTLTVTPSTARVRQMLTLRGRRFTCTSPTGALFRAAPVFFYHPNLGFRIFRVPVAPNGTYRRTITVPAKLIRVEAIRGGASTQVATPPGTYYKAVQQCS